MRLNPVEKWFVNSPIRRNLRERSVRRLTGLLSGVPDRPEVLEIGCGEGAAIPAILSILNPSRMEAFDFDELQVERARRHLKGELGRLALGTGSATAIQSPPAAFDVIFQFQVFHHIPNWRTALVEVNRVLRPGGYFIFTDTPIGFFRQLPFGPLYRALTDHPYDMMFSMADYERALSGLKFEPVHWKMLRSGSFEGVVRKPAGGYAGGMKVQRA